MKRTEQKTIIIAAWENVILRKTIWPGHKCYTLEIDKKIIDTFGTELDARISYNNNVPDPETITLF